MGEVQARIEVARLASELGVEQGELAYLLENDPAELRALRTITEAALFARHEQRMRLLAQGNALLPTAVSAKIAEKALGPALCARVAAVMEPEAAAKMVSHLSPEFLEQLAVRLDPQRGRPIIALLPEETILDIAARLIAHRELVTVAGLAGAVDVELAIRSVESAAPDDLREIALYIEEPAVLEAFSAAGLLS